MTLKRFLLAAVLSATAWISTSYNAAADCCVAIPAFPGNTAPIFITDYVSPDTLFTFTVTTGPIPAGTYGGWCIDAQNSIDPRQNNTVPGTTYTGVLYSTCDTNELALIPNHGGTPPVGPPPITSLAVWHQLNYLINHRATNDYWDVQVAINSIIGGPAQYNGDGNPADDAYPTINTNAVQSMISDAQANAANWHSQCGDKVAIVYVVDAPTNMIEQLVILEVPCCGVGFTTTPTNVDLGCNPATIPVCQNPVNTNVVNAISCCGRPVTITCSSADSTVNCKNYRIFTYVATDGFGNNATNYQTISWTKDTTAPVITSVPVGGYLGCNPASLPSDTNIAAHVSVSNTCSAATVTVTHVDSGTPCAMVRTFTITAKDACGLTSAPKTVVYTYKIDLTPPNIVCPSDVTLNSTNTAPVSPSVTGYPTVTDNCDAAPVVTYSDKTVAGSCTGSTITYRTWQAVDACGNTNTCTQTIVIGCKPTPVVHGDTATIGFWHNKNGQALINSLNGGSNSTALANWLATNFPYLYGANSANNLTGKKNSDVAALFLKFFGASGQKTDAQVLGGALASYVTDTVLAGTNAGSYGFNLSTTGTGAKSFNVGSNGAAIGLANNQSYTVLQLLQQANLDKQNGTFNANAFNDIFDGINQGGDIN